MPDWKSGDMIASRYELVRSLGRGAMGEVWLCRDLSQDEQFVALKIASEQHPAATQQLVREYDALKGLVHPYLPRVYNFGYVDSEGSASYLAMEYLKGDELRAEVLPDPQSDIHEVLVQLCRALAFLHTHGIIHGDLKPQNVVITCRLPLHLKLIDFGLAATDGGTAGGTPSGTLPYIAPELIAGVPPSAASDLYALGVMIFRLLAARFPFEGSDEAVTIRRRLEEDAPSPLRYAPRMSVGLADIVTLLLQREPGARPKSAREVIALLSEKEGRTYSYETVQSRAAYLKSSAYRPYDALREKILGLVQVTDSSGAMPLTLCGEPYMGLGALLNELARDLEKSGYLALRFGGSEWKEETTPPGAIWIVGPLQSALPELPYAAAKAGARALVMGVETQEIARDAESFSLPHLGISDLEEMLQAMFGHHRFPADFAHQLWQVTLGYYEPVHETLTELLNRERIDVGIEGWEWCGTDSDWPVSPSLLQLWQSYFERLNETGQKALALLAFSQDYSLPRQTWEALLDLCESEKAICIGRLTGQRWIDVQEKVALRSPVQASVIRASLPSSKAREIHGLLASLGPVSLKDPAQMVAFLCHQILSPVPRLTASEALASLRGYLKQGQARKVRQVTKEAMAGMAEKSPVWQVVLLLLYAESTALADSLLEARNVALKAVELAKESGLCCQLTESRLALVSILERLGEWDEAEKHIADCCDEMPSLPSDYQMLLLSSWAFIRLRKGDIEQAEKLAQRAMSQECETPESIGRLRQTLGNLAYFRGDLDAATQEWEAALKYYEGSGDARGKSDVHNNLGAVAARRGNRTLAREHWETCKRLSEQIGNQARVAGLLNNLAISSFEEGDLRGAERNYEEALRIYRRLDARRERIEILNNLGELNFYRANYPRARAFWNEALSEAETLGDVEAQVEPLVYLGKLHLTVGYDKESRRCFEQALSAAQECGSSLGRAHALMELALYCLAISDLEKASHFLDEAEGLLSDEADSALRLNLLFARLQMLVAAEEREKATQVYQSATRLPETENTWVARARLSLLALSQGESPKDQAWSSRIADFPEFAWRASWYQAQMAHASQNPRQMRQEIEKAASRLRMIAEQLAENERENYLHTQDARRFQKWARQVM